MSTQSVPQSVPAGPSLVTAPQPQLVKPHIVPMKVAFFGEQGTGKTATAALLAAALSKEIHGGAPIWVTDPELGWQFPNSWLFKKEGIKLEQRTVPTFKAMMQDIRDAEKAGACVWAVELVKIWKELLKTCQKASPNNWGSNLSSMWNDYVALFLNTRMHCFGLGRVGDVTEEVYDERGELRRIKTGETMKAGGSSNFGYEPSMVIRMSLEQKPKKKNGVLLDGEGRMVHCGYVLKDRTTVSNGFCFRWSDKAGYKPGGYRDVWNSFKAHFAALQETENVTLDTSASSADMIDRNGDSEWYKRQQQLTVLRAELKASLELLFGGQTKESKRLRMLITEKLFNGLKSQEAVDNAGLVKIERGVRIFQSFEKRARAEGSLLAGTEEQILAELDKDVAAYDQGDTEEMEMPF